MSRAMERLGAVERLGAAIDSGSVLDVIDHDPNLLGAIELGAAWQAAEAALPEGWHITGIVGPVQGHGEWTASAYGMVPENRQYGDGPTPAAALRAMAAKLREAAP